mmetsp:Transcript_1948/g.3561  ORF Transcript_1948/g.3561 Transcript_1948/m.3561 type:complete len:134 (-) Transcript_1948:27-428(-)
MSSKPSAVSKPTSSAKEPPSKQTSESSKDEHTEKSLRTLYRSYLSTVIVSSRTVDKIAQIPSGEKDKKDAELKKAVGAVVSTASKIKRKATILEERLCGNAKESEALHFLQRSQPTWNTGRKRKFTSLNQNTE